MTPARDPGRYGVNDAVDVAAELVCSAIAARDAAHAGAVILGRALAATREPAGSGRQEMFEEAVADAADAPADDYRLVLRWMAGSLIATTELAGEVLGKDPGLVLSRASGVRSLASGRGRKEGGVVRAMTSVVEGLACDAPSAECALEGLAAGLTATGRRTALAWSAEVTVGLLTLVCLATGHDEADLLSELAEGDLLDPAALLDECGVTGQGGGAAGAGEADAGPERSFGEAIRTAAAERRAIGVVTASRGGDRDALDAALAGLSRRETGEVCAALAGCVAGASAVAGAVLDELVEGVTPMAVGLIVDQAGAIGRGATGVDPALRRWLHDASDAEVRAVVGGFAEAAWAALAIAAADHGTDPQSYLRGVASDIASEVAAAGVRDADPCPCQSGVEYGHCCGR